LLLITHRFLGLDLMDEILVMGEGHIVERGTHETLMSKNGVYRRMVETQNRLLANR